MPMTTNNYIRRPIVGEFSAPYGAYKIRFAEDGDTPVDMKESHIVMCNMFLSMVGEHDSVYYASFNYGHDASVIAYDGDGTPIAKLVLVWARNDR